MALSSSSTNYFFWNDDLTCKDDSESRSASSTRAHAKGSLVYDSSSGAFLLHSLPRFPTCLTSGSVLTELPNNAGIYGQHFLCISVTTATANKLAELLNYINVSNNHSVNSDQVNASGNQWVNKLIDKQEVVADLVVEYQTESTLYVTSSPAEREKYMDWFLSFVDTYLNFAKFNTPTIMHALIAHTRHIEKTRFIK
jgi:hypothetical protein